MSLFSLHWSVVQCYLLVRYPNSHMTYNKYNNFEMVSYLGENGYNMKRLRENNTRKSMCFTSSECEHIVIMG